MTSTGKPLILFDIDLTLYNSRHFRRLYPPLMAKAIGISLEQLAQTQSSYTSRLSKSTDFRPEDYLHHIANTYSYSYSELHQIYFNPQLFRASLYPDTIPALVKLRPFGVLGIYSEGFKKFQLTKLKNSGIMNYFDPNNIYIYRRKLNPHAISKLPSNSFIIDDQQEVINKLSDNSSVQSIYLNRGSTTLSQIVKKLISDQLS